MNSSRTVPPLVRELRARGYDVFQKGKNPHWRVYRDRDYVCTLSCSTGDRRHDANSRAQVARWERANPGRVTA